MFICFKHQRHCAADLTLRLIANATCATPLLLQVISEEAEGSTSGFGKVRFVAGRGMKRFFANYIYLYT